MFKKLYQNISNNESVSRNMLKWHTEFEDKFISFKFEQKISEKNSLQASMPQ